MDFEQIEQHLKEAGGRRHMEASDPAALADRVLKTIRWRRITRTAASLVLLTGLLGVTLMNLPSPKPPAEIAIAPMPRLEPRAEQELAAMQAEISRREQIVQHLLAAEQRMRKQDRLSNRKRQDEREDPTERAAAVAVFEADRLVRLAGLTKPALKSYENVIVHFPQSISAEIAKHRVADIKKEG